MRSFYACLGLTLIVCLGMTGCNFKIPTWSELQGTAPVTTQEPPPPPQQQPVQAIAEPPKPPEPNAMEVIAKFKALKPYEMGDGQLQSLCSLKEGLETITEIDATASPVSNGGLSGISKLTGLRNLNLTGTKIDDGALAALKQSQSIEYLVLNNTAVKGVGLSALQSMTSLTALDLVGCQLSDGAWNEIGSLQNLERLAIAKTNLTNQAMESVCRAKSIKRLYLNTTRITDEGLIPLQHLDVLEVLDLGLCQITGEGLQFLAQDRGLKNLKEVSFGWNNSLTPAGANLILKCRSLEYLNMTGVTGVNDLYIKQVVSSFPSLHVLTINKAGQPGTITDRGIIAISAAKHIQILHAEDLGGLSDLSLGAMSKCKELEELYIDGDCTISGAQKFKKARPNCKLVIKGITY